MRLAQLVAIATLAIGIGGVAFAAEQPGSAPGPSPGAQTPAVEADDPQGRSSDTGGPDPTDVLPLGVDIGAAGTTKESRTAFFRGLSTEQQTGVQSRCTDAVNEGKREDIIAFCRDVMPNVGQ